MSSHCGNCGEKANYEQEWCDACKAACSHEEVESIIPEDVPTRLYLVGTFCLKCGKELE